MDPKIQQVQEIKLVGMSTRMNFLQNTTTQLWQRFMPRRNEVPHATGADLFSLQVYPGNFFNPFIPSVIFEKWAAREVSEFGVLPLGMDAIIIPEGMYAGFTFRGTQQEAPEFFERMYTNWLPNSEFELDQRPHFEVLGKKYHRDDPNSEEEVYIPIRSRVGR